MTRGIYIVAFGDESRICAKRLIESSKKHLPEIPICLCSDRKIGGEDFLIKKPDVDIGGRWNKISAYEYTPKEWQAILYLDADTFVCGNIRYYFELIEDGWEFVICKDPHLMDTMHSFRRRNNLQELVETEGQIFTLHTLQFNGGVWAFARNKRVAAFFKRWQREWSKYKGRDQGSLIRAMYEDPLRVYVLGNEWNTFKRYSKGIKTAGLMHFVGEGRRWKGMVSGPLDGKSAWNMVEQFKRQKKQRSRAR